MTLFRRIVFSVVAAAFVSSLPVFALRAEEPKLHSAVKPEPREGGWMARHTSFNERVKKGSVDLILIGDSITQGWEGSGKNVWQKFYSSRNAVNLGISGDRTQHVLWRLENGNLYNISPKLAVIMIGTNNSGSNTSEEIADGIKAIVEKLQKELPKTHVLILGIFPRGEKPEDAKRQVNAKANEIVAKLDDGKMVHHLDIGKKFLTDDGTLSKEIMPDLLHLSEKGYTIWAESIEPYVAKLMDEK
jgi:lysophospholipase L1-like esterase